MRRLKSGLMRFGSIVTLACVFVIMGCAPYTRAPKIFEHYRTHLKADLPGGWWQFNPSKPTLAITRDGLQLEVICVSVIRAGKEIKDTERRYQPSMQPHEIAELSLSLLEAREEANDLRIEKIDLVSVAGHDGYHATATYLDEQGLSKRLQLFGAMIDGYVCEFCYLATEPVYYDKYRPAFEKLMSTVRIVKR